MNFFLNKNQKNFRGILIEEKIFKFFFIFRVFPGFVLGMIRKFKKKKKKNFIFRVSRARGHKSVGVCKPWPSSEIQFCGSLLYSRLAHVIERQFCDRL